VALSLLCSLSCCCALRHAVLRGDLSCFVRFSCAHILGLVCRVRQDDPGHRGLQPLRVAAPIPAPEFFERRAIEYAVRDATLAPT
jgi:hypothetical protein